MANTDAAFGLRPVGHLFGMDWNASVKKCFVHASYATALFIGDPVALQTEADHLDTTGKHLSVKIAGAGDSEPVLGVIVAAEPNRSDLTKQYIPASTGGYVYVCTDPNVIYQIQDDGDGTPAKTWIGANADLASGSGSSTTGIGAWELDASTTPDANDSRSLFILGLSDIEGNELDDYAIWDVLINCHQLARSSTGDGTDVGILGVVAT